MTVADTDFFVDLMQTSGEHHLSAEGVAEEYAEVGRPIYMTVVTRFELFTGSERYVKPAEERARVEGLLDPYPTLPMLPEAADRAGKIHGRLHDEGRPIGALDAQIAAIALEDDHSVLTRNVEEFERVHGLKVETY